MNHRGKPGGENSKGRRLLRMIYLDNHATTRVAPEVLAAMLPYFSEEYGNAASVNHPFGWRAAEAVERAREQVASLLNCPPNWIVFTSGATEANNLAIKGVFSAKQRISNLKPQISNHFITNAAEHPSVLDVAKRLRRQGVDVSVLSVDCCARVDPQHVADAIKAETALVSVMLANNEVGTINPIAEIGRICRERGVLLHCDAVQAVGKLPVDLQQLPVDLLSLSAHKFHGPKGVGVLVVRRDGPRIPLEPLFDGGGHEQHLRSGTLPVPLIVGFGAACELVMPSRSECLDVVLSPQRGSNMPAQGNALGHEIPLSAEALKGRNSDLLVDMISPLQGDNSLLQSPTQGDALGWHIAAPLGRNHNGAAVKNESDGPVGDETQLSSFSVPVRASLVMTAQTSALRDRLWQRLQSELDGLSLNGPPLGERLPNNLNFSVAGVDGEALMSSLKEIAVSSGSACSTAEPEPSHVLRAMGISESLSRASLRFGLSRFTTDADIDIAVAEVVRVVAKLRA